VNAKHDYEAMEREYVTSDLSIRDLARIHGVRHHSIIAEQSTRREWSRKREEYKNRSADRAMSHMADKEGLRISKEMQVRDNAIEAIDEAISKMRADMKASHKVLRDNQWVEEPRMVIRPQDLAILIDRLNVLFGRPSNISEERNLGISISGTAGTDVLRGIVEATRGLSVAGDAALSPIPRSGPTREN
jgi:hypothetical protein